MTEFKKVNLANGQVRYRNVDENKFVGVGKLPKGVEKALENSESITVGDDGKIVDAPVASAQADDTAPDNSPEGSDNDTPPAPTASEEPANEDPDEDDGLEDEPAPTKEEDADDEEDDEAEDPAKPSLAELSKPEGKSREGFGYPVVKGKTVDIFDLKTPHEVVKYVGGLTVPLTKKNYDEKSDAEIYERVQKLRKQGKVTAPEQPAPTPVE